MLLVSNNIICPYPVNGRIFVKAAAKLPGEKQIILGKHCANKEEILKQCALKRRKTQRVLDNERKIERESMKFTDLK